MPSICLDEFITSPYALKEMNDLVICGTIGLDDIETPFGKVKSTLGGSGIYASLAASFFIKPGLVSIVGKDFPDEHLQTLKSRKINLDGVSKGQKTFRWSGFYEFDMNEAKTKKTELNSLKNFKPILPAHYKTAKYLFLANIDPELQLSIIEQASKKALILIDTMNYWIENKKPQLLKVIKQADIVLLNDAEARELFKTPSLILAAQKTLQLGAKYVIIKKGEHGALLFSQKSHFSAPGYPCENLKDPTGAGDSFAGGLIGYLSKRGQIDEPTIRKGVIFGSAIASYCAEDFGTLYRDKINFKDIKERYGIFREIRRF